MTEQELIAHLHTDHGIDERVAREVIGGDIDGAPTATDDGAYLRGFHDGMHGRVDADDLAADGMRCNAEGRR